MALIFLATLSGCGTKTPLAMPAGPATPPLFGGPAPIQLPTIKTPNAQAQRSLDNNNKKAP